MPCTPHTHTHTCAAHGPVQSRLLASMMMASVLRISVLDVTIAMIAWAPLSPLLAAGVGTRTCSFHSFHPNFTSYRHWAASSVFYSLLEHPPHLAAQYSAMCEVDLKESSLQVSFTRRKKRGGQGEDDEIMPISAWKFLDKITVGGAGRARGANAGRIVSKRSNSSDQASS